MKEILKQREDKSAVWIEQKHRKVFFSLRETFVSIVFTTMSLVTEHATTRQINVFLWLSAMWSHSMLEPEISKPSSRQN